MSEQKSILTRIREFQQEMEDVEILKSTEGYGYDYAALPDILKVITPVLEKHGLWYNHFTRYDNGIQCNTLTTVIYCTDNEEDCLISNTIIDRETVLPKMNHFMMEGAGLTYFRRYHLVTMLGLTSEEDTDAGGKRKKVPSKNTADGAVTETKTDFVKIFQKQAKTKTLAQFEKTFGAYKSQMTNDDIKAVDIIMKETYEDK